MFDLYMDWIYIFYFNLNKSCGQFLCSILFTSSAQKIVEARITLYYIISYYIVLYDIILHRVVLYYTNVSRENQEFMRNVNNCVVVTLLISMWQKRCRRYEFCFHRCRVQG